MHSRSSLNPQRVGAPMADEVKRYVAMRSDGLRQDDPAYPPIGPRYVDAKDFDRLARELAAWKRATFEVVSTGDDLSFPSAITQMSGPLAMAWIDKRVAELMKDGSDAK